MLRSIVIGTTGSGKTTFAQALARRLGLPHGEQDAWNHEANWQAAPLGRFRARVDAFTFGPAWVMDGNYGKARDIGWARADTLVWLRSPREAQAWPGLRRNLSQKQKADRPHLSRLPLEHLPAKKLVWTLPLLASPARGEGLKTSHLSGGESAKNAPF